MSEELRSNMLSGAVAMPIVALLLGLWHVGWSFAALPMWFWAALLPIALAGAASSWLQAYGLQQVGALVRTLCVGFGWGLGVISVLGAVNSLDASLEPTFFIIWSLGSLAYGYWMQNKQLQTQPAA